MPTAVDKVLRWLRPPVQPPAASAPPNAAGPRAAAEHDAARERTATYDTYRGHLRELDPDNPLLKLEPAPGVPPDQSTVESYEREVKNIVRARVDRRTEELKSRSTYSNRSDVRTIGGATDLRAEFDNLKVGGTQIMTLRGQYSDAKSELYELPAGQGRIGYRLANDPRDPASEKKIPTLEIFYPDGSYVRFHYNRSWQ